MASYLDDFVDVGTEETAGSHIKNDSNEWASFLEKKEHITRQVRVLTICLEKDSKYLIFDKEDAKTLFEKYRIFGKFNSIYTKGTEPFERCPVELSRIQVEMLLEQKLAKLCVRSMPENVSGVVEIPVVAPSDETILEYAVKAVKGRKAKSLKRGTADIDERCNAKKRKVKPSDLKNIEVGETDIWAAFEELKELYTQKRKRLIPGTLEHILYGSVYTEICLSWEDQEQSTGRINVFRDLWRKGFWLVEGSKFGCDYLAYNKNPMHSHAIFMVSITGNKETINALDLISLLRVATQVKKDLLLAIDSGNDLNPHYTKMKWWKGETI